MLGKLDRAARAFVLSARALFQLRAKALRGLAEQVLAARRVPADLALPGRTEWEAICRRFLGATWGLGYEDGAREVQRLLTRKGAAGHFSEDDLAGLPAQAKADVELRLGRLLDFDTQWTDRVRRVLVNGAETSASTDQVMQALGIVADQTPARLSVLAKTEQTAAYNAGRLGSFQSKSWFIQAVQFVDTLDERTTDICRSRSGLILELDDPNVAAMTPPLHYGCRSVLIPIDKYDYAALEQGDAEVEKRIFRNLPAGAPRTLDQAKDGWASAPRPQAGFGSLDDIKVRPAQDRSNEKDFPNLVVKAPAVKARRELATKLIADGLVQVAPDALRRSDFENQRLLRGPALERKIVEGLQYFPESLLGLLRKDDIQIVPPGATLYGSYFRQEGQIRLTPAGLLIPGVLQEEVFHLFDARLGADGLNLTEGATSRPRLGSFAKILDELFQERKKTGTFLDDYAGRNAREFYAQGLRDYLNWPEDLRELDDKLYSVLVDNWLNEKFWSSHL